MTTNPLPGSPSGPGEPPQDPSTQSLFQGYKQDPRIQQWGSQGDGTSNGDRGDNEFATKEDVSGIHSHLDEIQGGMHSGGGAQPVQNRMEAFGQGTGSQPAPQAAGTQRSGADILAGYHQQTLDNLAYAAGLHEQVSGAQASLRQRAANWAARSPQGLSPSLSGNAMSATQGSNTMNGLVSGSNAGGNGMSESTWANKKWAQQ
jgi:hypothetical protein